MLKAGISKYCKIRHHRYSLIRPEKPINAIAINPALINATGKPCKGLGIFAYYSRSRIPAKITIATVKLSPAANPFITENKKL